MEFTKEKFWLQFHDLPFMCKNAKFGAQIGQTVGNVLEYDVQPNGQTWDSTLRILIEIDITNPLA